MSLAALQIIDEEFNKANRAREGDHHFTCEEVFRLKQDIDTRIFEELVDVDAEFAKLAQARSET